MAFGVPPTAAPAAPVQPAFTEQIVYAGLNLPTNIAFAPDGRVFVAEKSGTIKIFSSVSSTTPGVYTGLVGNVQNLHDRGLTGMALDPRFPAQPYLYVLYGYNAPVGRTAPFYTDNCNSVGGSNAGQCVIQGRLSRLTVSGTAITGGEQVLLQGWCQQFGSHSTGDLAFGADGNLYVSGGDGASYDAVDYGQLGNPANPCQDPAGEGGALRSQDVRSAGDPTGLNGSVLRLNPQTGEAAAGNPAAASADANTRRIVANGLRNPFRISVRPGTDEVWVSDVGWNDVEEIDRITNATGEVRDFGWPCYEGPNRQPGYSAANLGMCTSLYNANTAAAPYYSYRHNEQVVAGEACGTGSSAVAGQAFYPTVGGTFPARYAGALFFSDFARRCVWAMLPGAGGVPDPARRSARTAGSTTSTWTAAPYAGSATSPPTARRRPPSSPRRPPAPPRWP
jgi:glucose/arabinose dehydrogenase